MNGGERTLDLAKIFRGVSFADVVISQLLGTLAICLLMFRVITELLGVPGVSFLKLIDIISRFLGTYPTIYPFQVIYPHRLFFASLSLISALLFALQETSHRSIDDKLHLQNDVRECSPY